MEFVILLVAFAGLVFMITRLPKPPTPEEKFKLWVISEIIRLSIKELKDIAELEKMWRGGQQ